MLEFRAYSAWRMWGKTCICSGGLEKGYCDFLRVRNGVVYFCGLFYK